MTKYEYLNPSPKLTRNSPYVPEYLIREHLMKLEVYSYHPLIDARTNPQFHSMTRSFYRAFYRVTL